MDEKEMDDAGTVTISNVMIGVYCHCGRQLGPSLIYDYMESGFSVTLHIDPCSACLEKARAEAVQTERERYDRVDQDA